VKFQILDGRFKFNQRKMSQSDLHNPFVLILVFPVSICNLNLNLSKERNDGKDLILISNLKKALADAEGFEEIFLI
jgi:hypothetical protein